MMLSYSDISINLKTKLIKIFMGAFLIFLCAQINIPIKPVPITLYNIGVLVIALCYKKSEALTSIISFVVAGACGIPVFASFGAGPAVLLGPTGGYIFGMVLCVYVITHLREKYGDDNWIKLLLYSLLGSACPFITGLAQLSLFVSSDKVFAYGLYPFIIPGIIKAFFTSAIVKYLKELKQPNT